MLLLLAPKFLALHGSIALTCRPVQFHRRSELAWLLGLPLWIHLSPWRTRQMTFAVPIIRHNSIKMARKLLSPAIHSFIEKLTTQQEDGIAADAEADDGLAQVSLHIVSVPSQGFASAVVIYQRCIRLKTCAFSAALLHAIRTGRLNTTLRNVHKVCRQGTLRLLVQVAAGSPVKGGPQACPPQLLQQCCGCSSAFSS